MWLCSLHFIFNFHCYGFGTSRGESVCARATVHWVAMTFQAGGHLRWGVWQSWPHVFVYLLIPFDLLHPFLPPPASGNHQSFHCVYELGFLFLFFLDSTYERSYIFVFLRFISLSVVSSRPTYVVTNGRISFIYVAELHIYTHTYMYIYAYIHTRI